MAPRPTTTTDGSAGSTHAAQAPATAVQDTGAFVARVLVTGSAGFVGFHVVRHLTQQYPHYNIIGLDRQEPCACLFALENKDLVAEQPPANYKFIRGSITSSEAMQALLKRERITAIVHCAALSHVDDSFGNALAFTEANVVGTHVLLEAIRALQQQHDQAFTRFVFVSSVSVYGNGRAKDDDMTSIINEEQVLAPTTPYAASKASGEMLVQAYHESFKLPTVTVRSCNVFGPHQALGTLIPNSIDRLLHEQPVMLHGDGSPTRQYVFIEDMVRALDVVLHDGKVGETYNISTKTLVSNAAVALDIAQLVHPHLTIESAQQQCLEFVPDRPSNGRQIRIDSTKLRDIGWTPQTGWHDGLRRTVDWWTAKRQQCTQHPRDGMIDCAIVQAVCRDQTASEATDKENEKQVVAAAAAH